MDKEDVVCIHKGILLIHKREWNNGICSNMDRHRNYYMKWNKSERETSTAWYHLYVEPKKNDTNKLIYKTETDSQTENKHAYQRGNGAGEG